MFLYKLNADTAEIAVNDIVYQVSLAQAEKLARDILARLAPAPAGELSPMARRILNTVYTHKKANGGNNPSLRELCDKLQFRSYQAIEPYLNELEAAGWLLRPDGRKARGFDWGGDYTPPARPFRVVHRRVRPGYVRGK
jgi:hypothetical protein